MQYFQARDKAKLAFQVFGDEEGFPFLLVHGFASTAESNWITTGWKDKLVEAGFFVIAPDVRGHGQSQRENPQETYARESLAMDMLELLDHLGLQKAHMMGYSMGGMIALAAGAMYGDRLGSIIAGGVGDSLLFRNYDMDSVTKALLAPSLQVISQENTVGLGFRKFAENNKQDLFVMALCYGQIRRPFPLEILRRIKNPCLFVVGSKDTQAGSAVPLSFYIKQSEVFVVEGKDHMKAVADPAYKRAVLAFVRSCEAKHCEN